MANPLLLLGKALLGSEAQARLSPYLPSGIQQLLPQETLGQLLRQLPSTLGYATGLLREAPSGNMPMDYMVGPQGVYDSAGNQMVTGQGATSFQPVNQYGLSSGFDPNAGDPFNMLETGSQDQSGFFTPRQRTQPPQRQVNLPGGIGGLSSFMSQPTLPDFPNRPRRQFEKTR